MKKYATIFLFALILQLLLPFTDPIAEAADSKTLNIDFQAKALTPSSIGDYYSASDMWEAEIDLSPHTGNALNATVQLSNGTVESSKLIGNTLKLSIKGKETTVYGRAETNPGHQIYRLPDGKRWEHKGERTPIIQFIPDDASSGVTQRPGRIPNAGYVREPGNALANPDITYYSGWNTPGNDLRYNSGTPPMDLADKNPKPSMDGAAVTRAYNATPPSNFFLQKPTDTNPEPGRQITEITNIRLAEASTMIPGIEPYAWDYLNGTNQIAVRRVLDKACEEVSATCIFERQNTGSGQLNNYVMRVQTDWEAKTYLYSGGTVMISYQVPAKPDLAYQYIKHDNACIQVGDTVNIKYGYKNIGVSTTTPFKVQLKVDGVVIHTENADGGANKDVLLGSSVPYKFTSTASKSFTLVVDSENKVDDENRTNNVDSVSFKAEASCSGGGGGPEVITGELVLEKTTMKFGESNLINNKNVTVTGGNGCSLAELSYTLTQGSLTQTYKNGYLYSVNFSGPPYPKSIGAGTVSVTMQIKSTCGTIKIVTPKTFEITKDPDNSPPVFEGSFFQGYNTAGYPPIQEVIVSNRVDLGVVNDPTTNPKTPYDPDGDPVIYYWNWEGSSSAWIRGLKGKHDLWDYGDHFGPFVADVEGTHTIEVTAIDKRGAVTGPKRVTLKVVPENPPPIPVITLPPKVVEGRPFTPDISGADSYSPRKDRTIVQYDWTGKQAIYPAAGGYPITLSVVDSGGIRSTSPAEATLNVQPDLPPVARLNNPGYGIRGAAINFKDTSYSPDDDPISVHTLVMSYDSNNDGSFSGESSWSVTTDAAGNFSYTPTKIGKYNIRIFIKEGVGYQKSDQKDFQFEVVNEAPEASFYIQGSDFFPPEIVTKSYSTSDLINNWKTSTVYEGVKANKEYVYNSGEDALETPTAPVDLHTPSVGAPNFTKYSFSCASQYCGGPDVLSPNLIGTKAWDSVYFTNPNWAGSGYYQAARWTTNYNIQIGGYDVEQDRVWYVTKYDVTENGLWVWKVTSLVYRISDLAMAGASGTSNMPAPVWQRAETIGYFDQATPPPSNVFYIPPEKKPVVQKYSVVKEGTKTAKKIYGPSGELIVSLPDAQGIKFFGDTMIYFTHTRTEDYTFIHYDIFINFYDLKSKTSIGLPQKTGHYYFDKEYVSSAQKDIYPMPDNRIMVTRDGKVVLIDRFINSWNNSTNPIYYLFDIRGNQLIKQELSDPTFPVGVAPIMLEDGKLYFFYPYGTNFEVRKTDFTPPAVGAESFNYGQFYNEAETLDNGEISQKVKFNYNNFASEPSVGISARMADHRNMYRLELAADKVRIVKIVNGVKTTLGEVGYAISYRNYYDMKIKLNGNRIRGYINGVPLLDVQDSTFTSGSFGPFSETSYVLIKGLSTTKYIGNNNQLQNVGIVGTQLDYVKSYSDLENDPAIENMTRWTYTHTEPNKFLDAGDGYSGISSLNGHTVTSPYAVLDKVGTYKIDYQIPDDPAPAGYKYPDNTFAAYRKYSDLSSTYVTIHRRPVSFFTLTINADKSVAWQDASYDPDRWLSPSNYSTEATGIDYRTNRGVIEYKRTYTTPSGATINGQLSRPTEWGWYTVRQAVKDEHGAWSDWHEVFIWLEPAPNNPPAVALTFPTGTYASPTPVSLKPTITWNQWDPDPNTTFSVFNLTVKDEWGNCIECLSNRAMYTQNTSWAWTMDVPLVMGRKYQAQVQVVDDGNLASPWSGIGWMSTNSPPSAYMSDPWGTESSPTLKNTVRPDLIFAQTDSDPGTTYMYMQLQITNADQTVTIKDSGKVCQRWSGGVCVGTTSVSNRYNFNEDLPAGQKLRVRVKVWDVRLVPLQPCHTGNAGI
ncbi:CARDB domain-containing protein [Paenibacillus validus]|uniref:CARDB domain-containing protein n=1 Tax=Paenibacillus validus TaxID=44253 RepID=UPI003D2670D4